MADEVWVSEFPGLEYFRGKEGLREKWYGHDWSPPTHYYPDDPPEIGDAHRRYRKGELIPRELFPEALYVFDEACFKKVGDLFHVGTGWAVRGKLAEVLAKADLAPGGLIPFPIYRADKQTLVPGEFFIWQFGGQRDCVVVDESPGLRPFGTGANIVEGWWKLITPPHDDGVAVSARACAGPLDFWCDPKLIDAVFFSGRLVDAMRQANLKIFNVRRCRVIED
jgi:hypothetical protein